MEAIQQQCPSCYDYITFVDGVAYCVLCDEVYTEDEVYSEELERETLF